jgi:hypothetical protein
MGLGMEGCAGGEGAGAGKVRIGPTQFVSFSNQAPAAAPDQATGTLEALCMALFSPASSSSPSPRHHRFGSALHVPPLENVTFPQRHELLALALLAKF